MQGVKFQHRKLLQNIQRRGDLFIQGDILRVIAHHMLHKYEQPSEKLN